MPDNIKRYRSLLVCVAMTIAVVIVYWQVFNNGFIDFDDPLYVTGNTSIQSGLTWQSIKWAFTTNNAYNWHPLTWLSHTIDCSIFGLDPAGHHFTSLLLHIANTILLFFVLMLSTGNFWPAVFAASLFALHPLHVESVAWASERKDVLSTFFWLLTMLFYIRYARKPRLKAYLPVMFVFALGLMAKQMLVTLPIVLLLLDYWPLQRFPVNINKQKRRNNQLTVSSFGRCFAEKIPLLFLSLAASIIVYQIQDKVALVKSSSAIPFVYRLGNAIVTYAEYIIKMFYPPHLGVLYPHPGRNLSIWQVLVAGFALLLISGLIIRFSRSRRWLLVGWFWYLGSLVPVIGLVQVGLQAMADRYTYIPLIGLFIIISWGAAEIITRWKQTQNAVVIVCLTILFALSFLTYTQAGYWHDSITLFEHTVKVTRNNDIMCYNLGQLYLEKDDIEQAIEYFHKAVDIKPDQPTIHKNLGILLMRQGKNNEAIEEFRQALKYSPNDKSVQQQLNALISELNKQGN
jgi:protein O-mannosyl-transferase